VEVAIDNSKKHLKEPEQSQFGNFASASSIPMGLQCAILTSALSCSSRLKNPAFVHEFWRKSTRRTQHISTPEHQRIVHVNPLDVHNHKGF